MSKTNDTTKNQYHLCSSARQRVADENEVFLQMVNSKTNPLTQSTLKRMIKNFPTRWKRFENWLPKLKID